jgi:5-methylcytosine-specific restriction protein A
MRAGLCARHYKQRDLRRGSPLQRGYDNDHREFRAAVLERDNDTCIVCGGSATIADHYPKSRRELVALGLDPNDPRHGRALCVTCHNRHTATTQSHLGTQ